MAFKITGESNFRLDKFYPEKYFRPMSRNKTDQSKPPQKSRQEEERDQRRQTILDAALKLFSENGYKETKLTEVAEEARLGKATLYYYFPDKETIFWTIYQEETIAYYQNIAEDIVQIENPAEIVKSYISGYIDYGYSHPAFLRLIFPLGKNSPIGNTPQHRQILQKVETYRRPADEHLAAVLEKSESRISGQELTELLWTFLSGLSLKIVQGVNRASVEKEAEIFLDLLIPKL